MTNAVDNNQMSVTIFPIRNIYTMTSKSKELVRFSISMPGDVAQGLDEMVQQRGFANRSQCLTSMVRDQLVVHAGEMGDAVMMGLITFVYNHRKRNLQNRLTDIQHLHLKEIISIQLVHLENEQSLQLMLVQGPAKSLRAIAKEIFCLKGVCHGSLQLNAEILPPLHSTARK
jgi:CopG family transcriptional regulator, nickel-responsive regulator